MKIKHLLILATAILAFFSCSGSGKKQAEAPASTTPGIDKAEAAGWKLGIQSYTFHKFTLAEALDKTKELGVKFIEVYPGHKLGGDWGDVAFGFDMTPEQKQWALDLAKSKDIKIIATGVFVTENADDWAKMFAFAKEMGMEFITCEPNIEHWDLIESLVKETGIKVSVHNHPQPSNYWQADLLLAQIAERDSNIGSGADVGHWNREGQDEVESLKKVEGRVISLHFKDIEGPREDGQFRHDVIWGKGVLNLEGMFNELKRQNFKGVFSIEYENNWENSVPDIKECIKHYDELTNKIF